MTYTIIGRQLDVTQGLKDAVIQRLSKLEKYFSPDTQARVTLSVQKDAHRVEVTIPTNTGLIRAEQESGDMYSSIDMVGEIIEKQIKKYKNKLIDKKQSALPFSELFAQEDFGSDSDDEIKIERIKRFSIKPMDAEEACLNMEMLGHSFYVFRDAKTDLTCVVYKRHNGSYGLIEPEI